MLTVAAGLGGIPPYDVAVEDLVRWIAAVDRAPATRSSYRASVRVFDKWAHKTGKVRADPSLDFPAITEPPGAPRPALDDMIADAARVSYDRVGLVLLLGALLGLRRGEISQVHPRRRTGRERVGAAGPGER